MQKIRERNRLKEAALQGMRGSKRASILFDDNYSVYNLITGNQDIFEKLGFFDENQQENREEYEYVIFYKGPFGTFFDIYSKIGDTMKWNKKFKGKNGQENLKGKWVYICDTERTKNLLLNVMKIGQFDEGKQNIDEKRAEGPGCQEWSMCPKWGQTRRIWKTETWW
jgi:hypothetical protein